MKALLKVIGSAFLVAGVVSAGNTTANMDVTASVTANCTISAGSLAFGAYDPIVANVTSPLNGSANLTVACTNNSAATILLGQGSHAAGGSTDAAPARQLKGALGNNAQNNFLSYTLTQDAGGETPWGNTSGTGEGYTGAGIQTTVQVFGSVTGGQTHAYADTYTDTVVATITF